MKKEDFFIDTIKVIDSSQEIMSIVEKLKNLKYNLDKISLNGVLTASYTVFIEDTMKNIMESVSNEVDKMDSLGQALEAIAKKYQEVESSISNREEQKITTVENVVLGTDKRNVFEKFWDWITQKEPDAYDTSTKEQEKAADEAMKEELWYVLQDEKYSTDNWDNATVEERKQILQDYMDEVIEIYELKDVKSMIVWDNNAAYEETAVTWGYYNHAGHKVTLNVNVLTDNIENWDSYELVETISHELRHAYQHEAIDYPTKYMVSEETILIWKDNFKNYISSSEDYAGYRAQPVEVDARDFQVDRMDEMR